MKIKDLCASERPREKMLEAGASAMGNAELLAILIRTGHKDSSAIALGNKLLKLCDGKLGALFNLPVGQMCSISGIGKDKACTIMAALELGRRFVSEESGLTKKPIVTARMVFELMLPKLKGLAHEECWLLLLNESNYLIKCLRLTSGGGNSTIIDTRQIIREAVNSNASGIILVHNHPSCNPRPSNADVKQTEMIHKAMGACGLHLLDHVIICDDCYYSFSDEQVGGM